MIRQFLFIFSMVAISLPIFGQGVSVADLNQDVALLRREVGQLRLQIEQLSRENQEMAKRLNNAEKSSISSDVVVAQTTAVQTSVDAKLLAMKREILTQIKKDMEAMASQTNEAMGKIVKAVDSQPKAELQPSFSNDYPKNSGTSYVVQSGDTLSKIAKKYKSKIKWIQDANQIADPKDIKVGKSLFIPLE